MQLLLSRSAGPFALRVHRHGGLHFAAASAGPHRLCISWCITRRKAPPLRDDIPLTMHVAVAIWLFVTSALCALSGFAIAFAGGPAS